MMLYRRSCRFASGRGHLSGPQAPTAYLLPLDTIQLFLPQTLIFELLIIDLLIDRGNLFSCNLYVLPVLDRMADERLETRYVEDLVEAQVAGCMAIHAGTGGERWDDRNPVGQFRQIDTVRYC